RDAVFFVAVFIGRQETRAQLADGSNIVELAGFLGDGIAGLVELFVKQIFDGGETRDVLHQLFHRVTGGVQDMLVRAGDTHGDRWLDIVNSGWPPRVGR